MKTPEEIANDTYWTLPDLPDSPTGDDYRAAMTAAIEADRAQRVQSAQQIRDALKSLPEGEAAQVALDTLRGHGYVVKAWSRDDLEATLDQWDEELTPDQRERVLDAAQDSGYFRNLADCTDPDWDTVGFALSDALSEVRAEDEGEA